MFGIKSATQEALEKSIRSKILSPDFIDADGHKLMEEISGAAQARGTYALDDAIVKFAASLIHAVGSEAQNAFDQMPNIDVSDAIENTLNNKPITISRAVAGR